MAEKLTGTIQRTYFASPKFSAGVLQTDTGDTLRFCGPFCANEGDVVVVEGRWKNDPKYGPQFQVQRVRYELPQTAEGLVQYLARHPAFVGIGEATARKIVKYAASPEQLDRLIRLDIDTLHRQLRVPRATLESLREAWIANSADNEVRSFLAGFGLTPHQIQTLIDTFGDGVVGVLRGNPYEITRHIKGYGFKKVDKVARAMGTDKDHPGRLEAGLMHVVNEEIVAGHTWISAGDLVTKANDLLLLNTLDSRQLIAAAGRRLLEREALVSTQKAITTPRFLDAERLIADTFRRHAWEVRPAPVASANLAGLKTRQADAFQLAMRHPVTVISGGAGTGKTHLVARLTQAFQGANLEIALCSPTGKAAKRIEESLRAQGMDLEAKTIHRLLKYDGREFHLDQFSQDVVITDEVSMVDVPLMAELLQRIDFARTRLILVGDHNQLPPVGAGNVLRDIIQHELVPTVVLNEVVRQAGILKANSSTILSGRVMPTATGDPAWTVVDGFKDTQQIQVYARDLVLDKLPKRLGLDPIQDVQIITPTHLGPLGTKVINQLMQRLLHGEVERKFAVGDKVIQTANDYDLEIMNGHQGVVTDISKDSMTVLFDGDEERTIDTERMKNVQLAYALTAHKCVAADTLIPSSSGLIRVEELASGIEVGHSSPREITLSTRNGIESTASIYSGGIKPTIHAETRAGFQIEGSHEHPVLVATNEGMVWKKMPELEVGDFLVLRKDTLDVQHESEVQTVTVGEQTVSITEDVGWLLGVLVGDGNYTNQKDARVEVTKGSRDLMLRYISGMQKAFGVRTTVRPVMQGKRFSAYFHSKQVREILARCGLDYSRASEKLIPHIILKSPPSVQAKFLQGLFDTDGGFNGSCVHYTTASERLAREAHLLLLHHGVLSKRYLLQEAVPEKGWSGAWRIAVYGIHELKAFQSKVGFSDEYKEGILAIGIGMASDTEYKSNWGVIPFGQNLAHEFREELRARGGRNYPEAPLIGGLLSRLCTGSASFNHLHLEHFCQVVPDIDTTGPAGKRIASLHGIGFFFDPITELSHGKNVVYDMEVPGSHSFIGNGIVNHNSQGSEFPCVVVLCHRSHYFADRNWLYTAVTRAARHCILLGDRWGLRNAVKKNNTIQRRTLLKLWAKPAAELDVALQEVEVPA